MKYRIHDIDSGYGSEYEREDGKRCKVTEEIIGKGTNAKVRGIDDTDLVVLSPVDEGIDNSDSDKEDFDEEEVLRKDYFFKLLYSKSDLLEFSIGEKKTYRLIVRRIPGDTLKKCVTKNRNIDQQLFFKQLIERLHWCHKKGIVIVDLKENNILCKIDNRSYQFNMIDGGLFCVQGEEVCEGIFLKKNKSEIIKARKTYPYLAPECFATEPVAAETSMDVYSLGFMIKQLFPEMRIDPVVNALTSQCITEDPEERPSLPAMKRFLENKSLINHVTAFIKKCYLLSSMMPIKAAKEAVDEYCFKTIYFILKEKNFSTNYKELTDDFLHLFHKVPKMFNFISLFSRELNINLIDRNSRTMNFSLFEHNSDKKESSKKENFDVHFNYL